LKNGLATLPDVLEARSAVAEAAYNVQAAIGTEDVARGNLATALGTSPLQPVPVQAMDQISTPEGIELSVDQAILLGLHCGYAQSSPEPIVRLAELEIDPDQLQAYEAALKEEIETSIRVEPGVLTLYAVSVKDHPNQIRLFERYSSMDAYQAHLRTPHFKKYKAGTQNMVKSLTLVETEPILLGSKSQ